MPNEAKIIDRGRGPEIAGTRITVFDIMDYWLNDPLPLSEIAAQFNLSESQVDSAVRYIECHRAELLPEYEAMLAREAQGNSLEIRRRLAASRERMLKRSQELRDSTSAASGEGDARDSV